MSGSGFKELPVIPAGPQTRRPGQSDSVPIVGIDLGTSNSLVAIVDETAGGARTPRVLRTREGRTLVPSVVHFRDDGGIDVGYAARKERVRDAEHTVYSVKRLLGKGAKDVEALEALSGGVFNLDLSTPGNVKLRVNDRSYTPIEISAMILRELKAAAEEDLGKAVEDAVITVPAYFNDSQRQATRAAGRLAGFNVLRILNEPTAAALAYGLDRKRNGRIAVYDIGGGTFDVSILNLKNGVFEVLATNGDTQLGGDDIDAAIAGFLEDALRAAHPTCDAANREARAAFLDAGESLKIKLSDAETATVVFDVASVKGFKASLTRTQLAELAAPILERTRTPVTKALKDAGLAAAELTDVVLVGGPTRLKIVQDFVAALFGRAPNASMHPDEVVAQGAAIQADILAGHNQDLLLLDVVPLSLGIETFGGAMSVLIPRNTTIPSMAKEQFTTHVDGQTKVAINVFQGERELIAENRKLAELVLGGVPPLPAGVARVEVTFLVDADGILSVSARELYSEVEASIEVKPTYGLTDGEVEKMLADGLANGAQDRAASRLIEARNDALTVLTATEKALAEARELLDAAEASKIDGLVADLKRKMSASGGDTAADAIKAASKALSQGTVHLAEVLMSRTLQTQVQNRRVDEIVTKPRPRQ